jgi:hypothetical protein
MSKLLSGLYYPFSRPIDSASLKQMLLVFDSVAFLDPVSDDWWRAHLFRSLEQQEDQRFDAYRQVHEGLPLLFEEGAARRIDPTNIKAMQEPVTTAAALSDLLDQSWSRVASNPGQYGMPHRKLGPQGTPTWQIFLSKMPQEFVQALRSEESFRKHLIWEADSDSSWTLSYEAGSAISINVHLSAAEELGFAPVSDSPMHHELLIRKLVRRKGYLNERSRPIAEDVVDQLTHSTAAAIVDDLLPRRVLREITFEEILRFRELTHELRRQAIMDIGSRLSVLSKVPDPEDLLAAGREVQQALRNDLRQYRAEISSTRDKLWPTLVGSLTPTLSSGSIAAVAMNFIGGPGYALAASVLAGSLALMKGALDIRAERKKVEASRAPAVTYLAHVGGLQ